MRCREQEDGSRADIDYVAAEYLWPVRDEDDCYETYRDFGPVGYKIYALTKARLARYSAPGFLLGIHHPGCGESAMPDPGRNPAADWLLAQYRRHRQPVPGRKPGTRQSPVQWRGVFVQPMFTLRNPVKSGQQMHIATADYADPGRWWL